PPRPMLASPAPHRNHRRLVRTTRNPEESMSPANDVPKVPSARPQVSEHEARAVAEGARESTWEAPSFGRELFLGRLDLKLVHPWPEPDAEEQKRGEAFLATLERFLREQVDAERIERDARIPEATIQGLRDMGAFGIKIPREYGGLELSQDTYCRAMSLVSTVSRSLVAVLSAHPSIRLPPPLP